jgi:hypothetical protein
VLYSVTLQHLNKFSNGFWDNQWFGRNTRIEAWNLAIYAWYQEFEFEFQTEVAIYAWYQEFEFEFQTEVAKYFFEINFLIFNFNFLIFNFE